jgi:choline dehydrogenase-like flavoprotein
MLRDYYVNTMELAVHTTSLPQESNSISLDPTTKDKWGRPALRITYDDHPDDLKTGEFLVGKAKEILDAAGSQHTWDFGVQPQTLGAHLLGTARMGTDPRRSVVNTDHRAHDVPNLFVCDGSSFVTSGRGQPTMTIQALAFRAADRITALARANQI